MVVCARDTIFRRDEEVNEYIDEITSEKLAKVWNDILFVEQ